MDLRQQLLTKGSVKKKKVTLTAEDGSTLDVEVRGLSSEARGRLLTSATVTDEESEETKVDLGKLSPELVIACTFTLDGERVFGEADRSVVGSLDAAYLDPIINAATELSGLSKAGQKAAEGNSAATTTSASVSLSPAS